MATISARIDDEIKTEAEFVAEKIGIPLSTAVNIFIKQFVANNGFPFEVVSPIKQKSSIIDQQQLDVAVKKAILNYQQQKPPNSFVLIDPNNNQIKEIYLKE